MTDKFTTRRSIDKVQTQAEVKRRRSLSSRLRRLVSVFSAGKVKWRLNFYALGDGFSKKSKIKYALGTNYPTPDAAHNPTF